MSMIPILWKLQQGIIITQTVSKAAGAVIGELGGPSGPPMFFSENIAIKKEVAL